MSEANSENQLIDIGARFDSFQNEAIQNIVKDFTEKPSSNFLLVIPTGGGKTFTAVRTINKLYEQGILNKNSDTVVWCAHREELIEQAAEAFEDFSQRRPEKSYKENVTILMMSGVQHYLRVNEEKVKLVVIDEAHHAASQNVQYGPIFDYPNLGILGLTATPSRHDGAPLNFEKESFSIGFPDLVEKQVILSPVIRKIKTSGRFGDVGQEGGGFVGLDELNTEQRNDQIIQHIIENCKAYEKIIVFACNAKHAVELHSHMKSSELMEKYEAIGFITGKGNSRNEDRKDFIKRIKGYNRSIVVNYGVLSEGYDDPKVNTIIMARPSRSKLVYMQAIGRGIRVDPNNPLKRAYIVEIADDLPNIRYRIDNRWLFCEVSDALEPGVKDIFFGTAEEFEQGLQKIYQQYDVEEKYREVPKWDKSNRYSLILFRSFSRMNGSEKIYRHIPILIDNDKRLVFSNWFNFLCERMEHNVANHVNLETAMQSVSRDGIRMLSDKKQRQLVFDTMQEASKLVTARKTQTPPWITYVALRFRQNLLSEKQQTFIQEMTNRDQIETQLKEKNYVAGAYLMRFPLPLSWYFGQIITKEEFNKLESIIKGLRDIKSDCGERDHRNEVRSFLDQSVLPVEAIHRQSLPAIVREGLCYYLKLE